MGQFALSVCVCVFFFPQAFELPLIKTSCLPLYGNSKNPVMFPLQEFLVPWKNRTANTS